MRVVVVDLDGTLLPGNSFHQWLRYLGRHLLRRRDIVRLSLLLMVIALRAGRIIRHRTLKRCVLLLSRTVPGSEARRFGSELAEDLRPAIVARLARLRADGLTVVLVTAAPEIYLAPVAEAAGTDIVLGTRAEVTRGWHELTGERKWTRLIRELGSDVDLVEVITDHLDDLPLVRRAARALIVAPTPASRQALLSAGGHVAEADPNARDAPSPRPVGALMVTHDSAMVAGRAIQALAESTMAPDPIVIVDSGSHNTTYLDRIAEQHPSVRVLKAEANIGFCAGNNQGMGLLRDRHVLLVNPDAFVTPDLLERAVARLEADPAIGAVQPLLLGAKVESGSATGLIDSAGIGQTRMGRLFDIGQGEPHVGAHTQAVVEPEALCAATMLLRWEAICSVTDNRPLFDDRFFMYKEDIDLSWRLRRAGWRIVVDTSLTALHCRGWQRDRRSMPAWARRRSLINEWRLWLRGWNPGRSRVPALGYLLVKSIVVWLERSA